MSKINKINVEDTIYDVEDKTSGYVTKDVNNLTNYELKVSTANNILVSIDSDTYVMTMSLRNSNNDILNTQTVDLPLETMVVGGSYDSVNKKIVLTLKNGNTIDVPVGDLINGLQSEITSTNKLDASLVDDSLSTNKFVTSAEKQTWNNKANTSDIPTLVSELTNDSDFQNLTQVQQLISQNVTNIEYVSQNSANPLDIINRNIGIYLISPTYNGTGVNAFYYKKNKNNQTADMLNFYASFLVILKKFDDAIVNDLVCVVFGLDVMKKQLVYKLIKKVDDDNLGHSNDSSTLFGTGQLVTDYNQSFDGIKTFNSIPKQKNTTAPTQNTEFTNKKYVDDSIANAITTTLNGSY